MINRYLRELGVKEKQYPFDAIKDDNRYIPDDTCLANSDTWSLYTGLAMIIYSYLMKFKETNKISYPANITHEKWNEILDDMCKGFASIIKGEESKRAYKRQKKALNLFSKWFLNLWW